MKKQLRFPKEVKRTRLRAFMKRKKLTSSTVAARMSTTPTTVRRWMSGQHEIPTATLEYIEYAFEHSIGV
jgi:transcriptional regulator with XRE-family HTH domain